MEEITVDAEYIQPVEESGTSVPEVNVKAVYPKDIYFQAREF